MRIYPNVLHTLKYSSLPRNTHLLNKLAAQSILLCIVTVLKETFSRRLLDSTESEEGILKMMADTHY